MFALDTNTLIFFFKGAGRVAERLLATPPSQVAVPSVVIYEVAYGIARLANPQKQRRQLESFMEAVTVLPFDAAAANAAAKIRSALESAGTPIGPLDLLIAGTALAHNATLVTHNTGEFSRISRLPLVDWF